MSVNVIPSPQPSTFWQRLTGTEPKTVVRETSTTEITNDPGGSFNLRTALRNGGIGAAVAGALGGVSLLGKVALPLIGKVASVGGLVKLAGVGGALGVATAALPLVAPSVRRSPAAKAALTGAAIGAAAGAVLPLMPITLGAAVGAGVGLLVHHRRNRPAPDYPRYPGYQAYPGWQPYGTNPGAPVPNGLVPVTPNYGMYGGTAMNPYGNPYGYAGAQMGYGMPTGGYGYGMLPMQGVGAQGQQPVPQPVAQPVAQPAPASAPTTTARTPKFRSAKTFTDRAGNLRQVGTGTIIRPAAGSIAPSAGAAGIVPAAGVTPMGAIAPMGAVPQSGLVSPYGGALPQAVAGSALPALGMNPAAIAPSAIPARPTM